MGSVVVTTLFVLSSFFETTSMTTHVPLMCSCAAMNCSCAPDQYCVEVSGVGYCPNCDVACNGCSGTSNKSCKECNAGYQNISDVCLACPAGTFGVNCTGICHCLFPVFDCNQFNGECTQCALGWSSLPTCQKPCSNITFGADCVYQCHCPQDDICSPINGNCDGGACADGWSSAGCQNELPQLEEAPSVHNVTCSNVTVVWQGWRKGIDRGNLEAVILQYEVYSTYSFLPNVTDTTWSQILSVAHVEHQDTYWIIFSNLTHDAYYRYRIDVRQQEGNKPMPIARKGKPSNYIIIPCTEISTIPLTSITYKPDSPLLDRTKINISILENPIVLRVSWSILEGARNLTQLLSLKYYLVKVRGVDCEEEIYPNVTTVDANNSGTYNITNLLPWRQYKINITATSLTYNITDFYVIDINTPEQAPTGLIQDIQIHSEDATSGTVVWKMPVCENRNGFLLYNRLYVYELPGRNVVRNTTVNSTEYRITALKPYTQYGVSVVYVNSKGAGPEQLNLVVFKTSEDVPGPPLISSLTSNMSSIIVVLQSPAHPNGVLVEFSVTMSDNIDFISSLSKNQLVSEGTSITFTNLVADTLYFVKARAGTSVGLGAFSTVLNITTKQLTLKPPANLTFDKSSRNETCVKLLWRESITRSETMTGYNVTETMTGYNVNETMTGYNISYHEVGVVQNEKNAFTSSTSALICDLKPGTRYNFRVTASDQIWNSDAAIIIASTEQEQPPIPDVLEVINVSNTNIGVYLYPVGGMSLTLYNYGYSVFVQSLTSTEARATTLSNTTCPGLNESIGIIVRNFTAAEVPKKTFFLIGDGLTYGAYENKALTQSKYILHYVLWSYFEEICKYSFSTTEAINMVSTQPVPAIAVGSSNTGLIAAIIVIILVIALAVVIMFLFCWLRNRKRGDKYMYYLNEIDDYNLKVSRRDSYDPQKYWNKTYSLRESRYIIAGNEFLPDFNKFGNESIGMSNCGRMLSFYDEFTNLPHGRLVSSDVANKEINKTKNRFSHLLPYDQSRVVLDRDANSNDYINASFIKGFRNQRTYIAAQSPFDKETVLDFWRMIYLYQVNVIIMLSNVVEDNIVKCTQYWPDSGRVMYGKFILDLVNVQEYADYTVRSIRVRTTESQDWQIKYIFDMTCWPEHGVPNNPIPLLEMRKKVNIYHNNNKVPLVVHCGTGIGRSGIYIAIDSLIEQYELQGRISVFSFVRKMRKSRPAMVRTVKQYIFIYETIFEAMIAGNTFTTPADLKEKYHFLTRKNPANGHSYLHGQFKCLQDFTLKLFPTSCASALLPVNLNKNRFIEIIPPDNYRPLLRTLGGLGNTDYINAVFLNSHRQKNHYVLTQTPLHTTVIDFWALVYDYEIHTIVMMEPMLYWDDTSAEYWPNDCTKFYDLFFVETTNVYQQENITVRNMKLTCKYFPKDQRHISQFQFNSWSDSEFIPKSKSMFLDIIDLVNDWQLANNNDATPILVHCKDGATHSGLFVAVSVLCEKVMEEGEVDVFHTVKNLKLRRTQIVDILDQYRLCYKALWDFINMRMPGGTLTQQMNKIRSDHPYSLSLTSYASTQDLVNVQNTQKRPSE